MDEIENDSIKQTHTHIQTWGFLSLVKRKNLDLFDEQQLLFPSKKNQIRNLNCFKLDFFFFIGNVFSFVFIFTWHDPRVAYSTSWSINNNTCLVGLNFQLTFFLFSHKMNNNNNKNKIEDLPIGANIIIILPIRNTNHHHHHWWGKLLLSIFSFDVHHYVCMCVCVTRWMLLLVSCKHAWFRFAVIREFFFSSLNINIEWHFK